MYYFFGKPVEILGRSLNQNTVHDVPDVTGFEAVFNNKIFLEYVDECQLQKISDD